MNKFLVCHNHITVASSARQERSLAGRIWSSNFSNNGLNFRYASNLFIWVSTFHQQLSEHSPSGRRREGGCELNTLNSLFQPEHHVKVNKMRNLWVKLWLFCSLFLVCLFTAFLMPPCVQLSHNCCGECRHLNFTDRSLQRVRIITNKGRGRDKNTKTRKLTIYI